MIKNIEFRRIEENYGKFQKELKKDVILLTLFLPGSGMTLTAGAGPLWPRIDSSHFEVVRRCPKAQNWLTSHLFDLQSFKDTKNTILWTMALSNLTAKVWWSKMKFLGTKRSKFQSFDYLNVMYLKKELTTFTIQIQKEKVWFFVKKKFFWTFLIFSPKGGTLWGQNCQKQFFQFFKNFWNKFPKQL